MTTFQFSAPDGQTYKVDGPEGSTAQQAFGVLQQKIGQGQKTEAPSMVSGLARSFARGAPIVGGLLNKADAATDAFLAPYLNWAFPEKDQLKGKTFGERYGKALKTQEGEDEAFSREHPIADTAAEIAGGVAATGGAAMTGTGAKLLGLGAKTLPGMIGQGAVSGAVVGGLDSATRGGDPSEGALYGGLGGAAGPVVAAGVGRAVAPWLRLSNAARAPELEAADQISKAGAKDAGKGLSPAEIAGAEQRGQPIALMDVGGGRATQRLARRAANVSPEAQEALDSAIYGRFAGQNTRTAEFLSGMTEFGDAHEVEKALTESAKRVNRPAYAKAYAAGANGIWSDELAQAAQAPVVQDAIRKTMVSAKNEAAKMGFPAPQNPFRTDKEGRIFLGKDSNGRQLTPSLQFWDYVKRNLDKGDRNAQDWAKAIRDHLDEHVPEYGVARGGAAQFFGAKDALQAGKDLVTPGTEASKLDNRVLRDNLKKYTPDERRLLSDGTIDQLSQTMLGKPDTENILRSINQTPKAKERLLMIMGPEKYQTLEAQLLVEAKMDRFRTAMGNSTTARQLSDISDGSVVPKITLSVRDMLKDFLTEAGKKLGRGIDERVATKIAEMLVSNDGAEYRRAVRMIARNKNLMAAVRLPGVAARGAASGAAGSSQDQSVRTRGNVTVD
jgi:hypothetical protein